ncbi:MAG: methyltransferase domain-containing protein [Pseudohongiella sp.]|nr:methyltransferase domain-containing protein [Pseudohongiella sp.]
MESYKKKGAHRKMGVYRKYTNRALKRYKSGEIIYKTQLGEFAQQSVSALHVGCGHDLAGVSSFFYESGLVGIDLDAEAIQSYPRAAWLGDAGELPFADGSFDLVFSEYVLEHLTDPDVVFQEISRVLTPSGVFLSLAPNYYSYKSLAAKITPHSVHRLAVKLLRPGSRDSSDVYPTVFKANTPSVLSTLARQSGLEIEELIYANNGPTWFQRIPVLFEMGQLFHSALDLRALSLLRCNIIVILRKPGIPVLPDLQIRCIKCFSSPMADDASCYTCPVCHCVYKKSGNVVKTQ